MSKMKEKNLRHFVAIYLTSSILFSGITCAAESEEESFYADGAPIVVESGNPYDGLSELYGGHEKMDGENGDLTETNLTVNSGRVGSVTGGSSPETDSNVHVGTANITIHGGSVDYIQGGGEADYGGATATVDTVNITINGGDILNKPVDDLFSGIYGGGMAWAGEVAGETNRSDVKTVNIKITGGTIHDITSDEIDCAIFGGGLAGYEDGEGGSVSNATASAHVDTVHIDISGGTIQPDIYAGGNTDDEMDAGNDDKLSSTVDNATINISGGDIQGNIYAGGMNSATVKNSTINISGGKIGGNLSADLNVTGSSALNFTAGTGSSVDGAISGFDTITLKNGAKTTLTGTNVADGTAAIQANALQIEENSTMTIAKTMTFNLGSISSPIPAAFSLHSARVANGVLNLSGELKIMTGAELTLANTTLVSNDTGMVTVGAEKNGAAFTVGTLNMAANSNFADQHVNLNIGLPIDEIKNLSADEINTIIETALAPTAANGLDIGSLNISNGTNAEYQYIKDDAGKIVDVKLNDTYLGFYTGVRQANAYITQQMLENIHDRNASLRGGAKTDDFWVNLRGGSTDVENSYGEAEVKNQYYQLGYDWDVSADDNKAVVGVYFSKIYGDITQYNIKSDIDNAYDFGIYGMKEFSNGNYLGLVGRYGQTKNTAKIDDRNVDWKDKGYGLSAEFGKRMQQKSGWMLEPYMQLSYHHLSDADLNTGSTDAVLEGSNLLDGRIGVRFIQQEKANPQNTVYGGLSYVKGLSGDFKMKSKGGLHMIDTDNDAGAFEVMLGVNRQLSQCSTINLNVKKEFGDYDGWGVQGTVNVAF